MRARAAQVHAATGRSAGNGALMRTSPVALAHLGDADAIASAARAVSALTHHDPQAGEACVLWCLAIDHAVRTGKLEVRIGLDHVGPQWAALLDEAEDAAPARFAASNGWVVPALQAAWSAIVRTGGVEEGLQAAVHGGGTPTRSRPSPARCSAPAAAPAPCPSAGAASSTAGQACTPAT
jgi:hypothetical protein